MDDEDLCFIVIQFQHNVGFLPLKNTGDTEFHFPDSILRLNVTAQAEFFEMLSVISIEMVSHVKMFK